MKIQGLNGPKASPPPVFTVIIGTNFLYGRFSKGTFAARFQISGIIVKSRLQRVSKEFLSNTQLQTELSSPATAVIYSRTYEALTL